MNREDFPMLKNNIIYFDNGATTFKPTSVIERMNDYYQNYNANAHRGDYNISLHVDNEYELVRSKVKEFINADKKEEIVFTSGTTESINMVVFGYLKNYLKENDEIITSKSEHASNILPLLVLQKELHVKIKYIEESDNQEITIDNVKKLITPQTKVISLAYTTNVLGDTRPIKEIGDLCQENKIILMVDAAQAIAHQKIDVKDSHIDFLSFSAHKMYGPTGVGVLYGKYQLLEKLIPINYGGGMNNTFTTLGDYELKSIPTRFEAGTPNIAGVIGLGASIDYLNQIGMNKIYQYEHELRSYLINRLEEIDNIILYNKNIQGTIVAFNIKDVFSQDTAIYLNKYNICVRAGNHCAKTLKEIINIGNTCRISLSFYNTKEEIDLLINVLKNSHKIWDEIL